MSVTDGQMCHLRRAWAEQRCDFAACSVTYVGIIDEVIVDKYTCVQGCTRTDVPLSPESSLITSREFPCIHHPDNTIVLLHVGLVLEVHS